MRHEHGSSLVVALILLAIITVVAVYSLEGSNIQSKMVANSLLSSLTYQECRNEQEAQIRHYNMNSKKRDDLLTIAGDEPVEMTGNFSQPTVDANLIEVLTKIAANSTVKSDISLTWRYMQKAPKSGTEVDTTSQIKNYLYENDCLADYSFSQSNQTQGAFVEGLQSPGQISE